VRYLDRHFTSSQQSFSLNVTDILKQNSQLIKRKITLKSAPKCLFYYHKFEASLDDIN
jgi:hypothetical protein